LQGEVAALQRLFARRRTALEAARRGNRGLRLIWSVQDLADAVQYRPTHFSGTAFSRTWHHMTAESLAKANWFGGCHARRGVFAATTEQSSHIESP
jgi:hypothetical protein